MLLTNYGSHHAVLTGYSPRIPGSNCEHSIFVSEVLGQVFSCQDIIPAMLHIHLLVGADTIGPFKAPVSINNLSPHYATRRAYQ
jgi:hypothetical protein